MATIQFKRGALATMPALLDGEPAWATDAHALYIGQAGVKYRIGTPAADSVTAPMMHATTIGVLFGRTPSAGLGPGAGEEITLGAGLAFTGTVLSATGGASIAVVDTATIDLTLVSGSLSADVKPGSIASAQLAPLSAESRLLGRGQGAGGGAVQELSIGAGLAMVGGVLSATGGGSAAPSGPAGGDLTGTYPNPQTVGYSGSVP